MGGERGDSSKAATVVEGCITFEKGLGKGGGGKGRLMTTMQTGRAFYSSVPCDNNNNNNVGQGETPKKKRISEITNCNESQLRYKGLQWN